MQIGIQQAIDDGRLELWHWADNVIQQIKNRMDTQKVWPQGNPGPYAMYKYINDKRKKHKGSWYSTGQSYNQIFATVFNAAGGGTERITFFFREYLEFVDMGVGAGVKAGSVERSQKAKYNSLYAKWGLPKVLREKGIVDTSTPRRHRPILMMELRHQLTVLDAIVKDYYGEFSQAQIIQYLTADEKEVQAEM